MFKSLTTNPPPSYNILNAPLIKQFNDLLDTHRSEQSWAEVTYFYVGDVFCIHLGTKYADFQEKIFAEIFS